MTKLLTRAGLLAGLFAGAVLLTMGCNKSDPVAENKGKEKGKGKAQEDEKDDHSGWWCKPHGIPEEECSMCSEEYAKKCKEKGDWCEKHDRADSQCFICHPEYKEKFAAKYRAKYGTEPPPMKAEKPDGPGGTPVAAKPGATTITVPDMDCEACAKKAVAKLTAVAGVAKVDVNVEGRTLTVTPKADETPSPKALWEASVAGGQEPSKLEGPGGAFTTPPGK
jgi:copper chaperone CopZ